MSQSVDDMSQNKIVTNRPSAKQNCDKSSISFWYISLLFCDISSRTIATCDKSSVTYVTNNLIMSQSADVSKRERCALFILNKHELSCSDTCRLQNRNYLL